MTRKLVAAAVVAVLVAGGAQANLVVNGGFESGTYDGWSSWNSGSIGQAYSWGWQHSGTGMVQIWWDGGLYQDIAVGAGNEYALEAFTCHAPWDAIVNGQTGVVGAITLQWRDAATNLITDAWQYRFGNYNQTALEGGWYTNRTTQTAPGNAAIARVQVQVWNDGGGSGRAFFDDVSFDQVVPEPASLALLGIAGVALLHFRKRRNS